ncbi:MAG: hypothetical protein KDE17_14695 [Rhodobacteraceae bacterium]|nr:hypothetical protein [Paracoccaceae bacterium]MCC0047236.1 hypothetical protein [Defluviimonas sp.]
MSKVYPSQLPVDGYRAHFATSRRRYAPLTVMDRQTLLRHLAWCEAALQPSSPFLGPVIRYKIETSLPSGEEPPADAVTGGCRVTYSIDGGQAQTGLVTQNARIAVKDSGVIPVPSLLGATLIGLRVGQCAPMLCEDGTVVRLKVLGVAHPA